MFGQAVGQHLKWRHKRKYRKKRNIRSSYNFKSKEYKEDYAHTTPDYLSYHDFYGLELILEPDCR